MDDLRRRFRRRFALISTAVTLAAAVGVAFLIAGTYWNLLTSIGESRQGQVGAEFYAAAREQSAVFLDRARALGPEAARDDPEAAKLLALVKAFARATPLSRVAIHDADGYTLFSTEPGQIGSFPESQAAFAAAQAGKVTATRREVTAFRDFAGIAADRMIFETFVPVHAADGRRAVVALYTDTTRYQAIVDSNLAILIAVTVGALFAVLGMLIFYVGRDRMLAEQHGRNAALAEAARLAEERSRLKSRFLASLGHELRTPLNAILGFAEAMKVRLFGPLGGPKYEEYAAMIHSSGRHLLSVIDDILDVARIEGGKAALNETEFPLGGALANCARMIGAEAERHGLAFTASLPEDLPRCRGDEGKINQIVLNLLSNAVRYTPRGGRVTLAAERRPDGAVAIGVADTGVGIPPEQLGRVFEPFRQVENPRLRKKGGLGLGLGIAKAFADLHQAELALESEPGRGTTARLVLPPSRLVDGAPARLPAAA
jgi:signal transduction histidine kinase